MSNVFSFALLDLCLLFFISCALLHFCSPCTFFLTALDVFSSSFASVLLPSSFSLFSSLFCFSLTFLLFVFFSTHCLCSLLVSSQLCQLYFICLCILLFYLNYLFPFYYFLPVILFAFAYYLSLASAIVFFFYIPSPIFTPYSMFPYGLLFSYASLQSFLAIFFPYPLLLLYFLPAIPSTFFPFVYNFLLLFITLMFLFLLVSASCFSRLIFFLYFLFFALSCLRRSLLYLALFLSSVLSSFICLYIVVAFIVPFFQSSHFVQFLSSSLLADPFLPISLILRFPNFRIFIALYPSLFLFPRSASFLPSFFTSCVYLDFSIITISSYLVYSLFFMYSFLLCSSFLLNLAPSSRFSPFQAIFSLNLSCLALASFATTATCCYLFSCILTSPLWSLLPSFTYSFLAVLFFVFPLYIELSRSSLLTCLSSFVYCDVSDILPLPSSCWCLVFCVTLIVLPFFFPFFISPIYPVLHCIPLSLVFPDVYF